jgi:hypothetical protein
LPGNPPDFDGLRVELELAAHSFEVAYRMGSLGCGPIILNLNGSDPNFTRGENPYRTGAAEIPMAMVVIRLTDRFRYSLGRALGQTL